MAAATYSRADGEGGFASPATPARIVGFDVAQVAPFLADFSRLRDEMTAAGRYPYNDSFRGLIPGIAGPTEDRAIYLLQTAYALAAERARIDALPAQGYAPLERLDATTRYARVLLWREGHYVGGTGAFIALEDARIVPDAEGRPAFVLPKGRRNNGHRVNGAHVFVSATRAARAQEG